MSATLGGQIKDFRSQKNISQLQLALALGWKEPSRLSRIEQGKVGRPTRQTVDNLARSLNLTEEEKSQLLVVGNYLPSTEEVVDIRKKVSQMVDEWPYPAACLDYTWRIIYQNRSLVSIYDISPQQQVILEKQLPWIIEIALAAEFPINIAKTGELSKHKDFILRLLTHFYYAQRARVNEQWYQKLIQRMMHNKLFQELWPEAQKLVPEKVEATNFGYKSINGLNFYFTLVPIFHDPRFIVEFHIPADSKTYRYFEKGK